MRIFCRAFLCASLVIFGYGEVGLALKQLRSLGMNLQVFSLSDVLSPDIRAVAGNAVEGVLYPSWSAARTDRFRDFMAQFKARTGREPALEVSTVPSYDVAALLVGALREEKEPARPSIEAVRRFFYSLRGYRGASGTISIDSDGVTRSLAVKMQRVRGAKLADE